MYFSSCRFLLGSNQLHLNFFSVILEYMIIDKFSNNKMATNLPLPRLEFCPFLYPPLVLTNQMRLSFVVPTGATLVCTPFLFGPFFKFQKEEFGALSHLKSRIHSYILLVPFSLSILTQCRGQGNFGDFCHRIF